MVDLTTTSTLPPESYSKAYCKEKLHQLRDELFQLQNVFYASSGKALLIILQGVDASGKDGTIRHVFSAMNPQGVQVKSFKRPTEVELQHDFLWRIYPHFPELGMMRVFNRSYYEDIVQPRLEGRLDEDTKAHRFELLNVLENHLERNNTIVLKFFLHISKEEQEDRINARLTKPHKRWKYDPEDIKALKQYDDYMRIYSDVIKNTSDCSWHVVPADKKWYRNYIIAKVLADTLKQLNLKYPTS